MVNIIIPLFYKPSWEIELEGKTLDINFANELRKLGDELKERLYQIAELHEKLLMNGWKAIGGQYDITYFKELSIEEAEKELRELKIDEYLNRIK